MRYWKRSPRQRPRDTDGIEGPKSTVLTPAKEAIVVAFRQKTTLQLDDMLTTSCLPRSNDDSTLSSSRR
jgi:hypothetical protein